MTAVPWDDDTERLKQLMDEARKAQAAGRWPEAADLFRQSYDLQPAAFAASRTLHCMRRQGVEQARRAVLFGREPVKRWPLDTWLVREYVWAIYDGYLKAVPAEADDGDSEAPGATADAQPGFEVKVKAARRILKLSQEDLPRARAVFAICRVAKARRQWPLVLEFALAVDPSTLSDEAKQQNGRTLASDRQQWLQTVTRAYLELEQYDECCQFAQEGIRRYPHVMFFPWWHALARVRGGDAAAGLRELEEVQRRFVAPWYVQRDLGEACERLQRDEEAWRWYCAAAGRSGEPKQRVAMLVRMAGLLERQQRWSPALDHLLLSWALAAREEGWEKLAEKNRELVGEFLARHAGRPELSPSPPEAPPDFAPLLAACREAWSKGRM